MIALTKNEIRTLMGENLRKLRMERGLSLEELAKLLGISPAFLGLVERGRRGLTAYNIFKLTTVFDISAEAFLTGIDDLSDTNAESCESICHKKLAAVTRDFPKEKLEFLIAMADALEEF